MSSISNLTTTDAPLWETSEDHGPVVSVVNWFLIVTAFLAVLARVSTRYAVIRRVRMDDATIVLATILAIGQSITTSLQAANGLGQHIDRVPPNKLIQLQKNTYADGFLYIAALSTIKISVCFHLYSITPIPRQRIIIVALGTIVCLWMISCFFSIGFECALPHPWRTIDGHCIDITGFWTYAHIVNILTDVALVVIPFKVLSNLQVKNSRKYMIIGCFGARIFVIIATIVQIYFLQTRAAGSRDITYNLWTVVLLKSIVQAFSLIAACIPYLKPFMGALETGMIRADGGGPSGIHGFASGNRSNKIYMGYGTPSKNPSKPGRSQLSDVRMDSLGFSGVGRLGDKRQQTAAVTSKGGTPDSDNDSQTSQSKIIRKTVGWSVTEEPQIPPHTHLEPPTGNQYDRV